MSTKREDEIRTELERIRKANGGRLTKAAVLLAARHKKNVLHREFIWDDKVAANKQRLERAAELIVRYVTIVTVNKNWRIVAPYYVRSPNAKPNESFYIPITSETINRETAERIVMDELSRCENAIWRARAVSGTLDARFPGLTEKFEAMLEEIVSMKQRLGKGTA